MHKQKILFLTSLFPFPPKSGAALRDAGTLHSLAAQFSVELVCVMPPGAQEPEVPAGIPALTTHFIERHPNPTWRRLLSLARPYVVNGYSAEVESALAALYEPGATLWISRLALAQYIPAAKKMGYHTILDEHNVESNYYWQAIQKNRKWNELHLAVQLQHWERKFCLLADQVVVTSERDAALLRKLCPGLSPAVIVNSVPVPAMPPKAETAEEILFVGTLDYFPNAEGLSWFLRHCWPKLRAADHKLTIVGAKPSQKLQREIEAAGANLYANAPDLKAFYQKAAVCIAPILSGGGTRLKILEALAWGKLVVSTSKGAEGLSFTHDQEILLADSPEEFTHCVARALASPEYALKVGAAGHEKVKKDFSWDSQAKAVVALCKLAP